MNRDIVLKLIKIGKEPEKVKAIMGMCEQTYIWKSHRFFQKIRYEEYVRKNAFDILKDYFMTKPSISSELWNTVKTIQHFPEGEKKLIKLFTEIQPDEVRSEVTTVLNTYGNFDVIRALITLNLPANIVVDQIFSNTFFLQVINHILARSNCDSSFLKIVEMLILAKADLEVKNYKGFTPLLFVLCDVAVREQRCGEKHEILVEMLLEYGADPTAETVFGTALDYANQTGNVKIKKLVTDAIKKRTVV